jgi:DNA-binding response OmpR family regulator
MCTTEGRAPEPQPSEQSISRKPAPAVGSVAGKVGRGNERPARILVVDDNVDLARGLARLLQIHGHDVRIAYDGPSGLVEARKSTPDIVLLDIGLPGMDGYQLATRLRHEENFKNATLIAISGYGQEEDVRLAREAGFDHHLVKPIASDELIKLLRESDR